MDTSPTVPDSITSLLAALADQERQRVLKAFLDAGCWELPASEIADRCAPLSRSAASHHLAVMRRSNVLIARKEGKHIFYAINRDYIRRSLQSFLEFLDRCCPESRACQPTTATTEVTP